MFVCSRRVRTQSVNAAGHQQGQVNTGYVLEDQTSKTDKCMYTKTHQLYMKTLTIWHSITICYHAIPSFYLLVTSQVSLLSLLSVHRCRSQ